MQALELVELGDCGNFGERVYGGGGGHFGEEWHMIVVSARGGGRS